MKRKLFGTMVAAAAAVALAAPGAYAADTAAAPCEPHEPFTQCVQRTVQELAAFSPGICENEPLVQCVLHEVFHFHPCTGCTVQEVLERVDEVREQVRRLLDRIDCADVILGICPATRPAA